MTGVYLSEDVIIISSPVCTMCHFHRVQFCLWFPPGTSTDRWLRDTNSHSVNPPSLHLFQHPPAFLLLLLTKQRNVQDLSALLPFLFFTPPHSLHPPGRTFFTVNSTLVPTDTSVELMILGLSIFSLFFSLPHFFQAHHHSVSI